MQKKLVTILFTCLILCLSFFLITEQPAYAMSAGLFWGPMYVGNLKISVTNSHIGSFAGYTNATHINLIVDRKEGIGYENIANYHIIKYSSGLKVCLYIYESNTNKVVFNNCDTDFASVAGNAVSSMFSQLRVSLSFTDVIFGAVIIAAMRVALIGIMFV